MQDERELDCAIANPNFSRVGKKSLSCQENLGTLR
jgi:hypothetical protein